ncbi:hypothetical protein [Halomonas denitrificans]|nr:hypothetical protein [Halomonas denitrificans]
MNPQSRTPWIRSAGRRIAVTASLIVIVTLAWVVLLFRTDLPLLAMIGIGVVSLLLLSVAVAWAAMAVPRRPRSDDDSTS